MTLLPQPPVSSQGDAPPAAEPAPRRVPRPPRLRHLLSNEKSFRHRWVGSPLANRLGLHAARVRLAELCAGVRRASVAAPDATLAARLRRDGLLVIEDALPPDVYAAARAEFQQAWAEQHARVPAPRPRRSGFGAPKPNPWGFDRYDGGSLNRFMRIDETLPALQRAFGAGSPLLPLLESLCAVPVDPDRFLLYELVHGPEPTRPDLQREVHCDTFHETYKLWYFFDAVDLAQGPLRYAVGSHRNTAARLRWEQRSVVEGRSRSAAFRIDEADLAALGWQPPQPVITRPNSLVLADTRGFHCRSVAPAGTVRPCVYANLRSHAFGLRVRGQHELPADED